MLLDLWLARSVLTEGHDGGVWGLRLPRWRSHESWSPWNCVLLTAREARAHERLPAPEEVYAPELVATVRRRHLQARRLFARLMRSDEVLRETSSAMEIAVGDG